MNSERHRIDATSEPYATREPVLTAENVLLEQRLGRPAALDGGTLQLQTAHPVVRG